MEKQVAPRQIKMPDKDNSDKEAEEAVSQRKRPESGRYLLQVDKQTKGSYKTPEAAQSAALEIKIAYPIVVPFRSRSCATFTRLYSGKHRPTRSGPIDLLKENAVSGHKFKIGQSVNYTSGLFSVIRGSGIYTITQLLPPEGDDFQYKIKSAAEPHERVAKESQLNRAT